MPLELTHTLLIPYTHTGSLADLGHAVVRALRCGSARLGALAQRNDQYDAGPVSPELRILVLHGCALCIKCSQLVFSAARFL